MENKIVKCGKLNISNTGPFTLIAGPCQLENEAHALKISNELKKITSDLGVNFIYKTSFDKANRTSLKGKRGIGLEKSLPIFDKIKKELGIPVLTDVHSALSTNDAQYIVINLLGSGRPIVIEKSKVKEAQQRIQTKYNIIKDHYLGENK